MRTLYPVKSMFALALVYCLSTLTLYAQPSKNFSVNNFSEVAVASGIDLYLTQNGTEAVKVVAHDDLLKNVIVEKNGNTLTIRYKDNSGWGRFFKGQSIKAYVNFKTLTALSASGGSDVFSQAPIKTDRLNVRASGGSDLKLDLTARDFQLQASGGSDVTLKGSATNMEIQSSGGSDIKAYEFKAENAKVSSSGGSDANVYVTRALEASASGGSDIHYKGDAALRNNSSKSGDVTKVN